MRTTCLLILLLHSSHAFSQLDSLKGNVKGVLETGTADFYRIPYYLRETSALQRHLDQETIFWEFKRDMFPRYPKHSGKEFDRKGKLTKSTFFNIPGRPFYTTVHFKYNTSGNLVQARYEFRDSTYFHWRETNYKYLRIGDVENLLSKKITYGSDPERFELEEYFYDESNRLVEKKETSSDGSPFLNRLFYDASGNLILDESYRVHRKLIADTITGRNIFRDTLDIPYQVIFVYNPDGTLKQKSEGCTPGEDNWCRKIVYEYNNDKKFSKIIHYRKDTVHSWRSYEYYPDQLIKRMTWHSKSAPADQNSVEYSYEEKELTRAILRENGRTYTFDFEYVLDRYKNWIEQKKYLNNELLYTRKRTISYWD